jgi:hypothetical protein
MSKYIHIEADTNDGDYVAKLKRITEEEIVRFRPIIKEIVENDGKYETGDIGNSAEELYGGFEYFDDFRCFVPYGEYGVHTIEQIKILEVINVEYFL